MALIEFQNNTAPYLNADNLNNNFNYLDEKAQDIYSTTEIVIGKWIDNKPLYRKVVDVGTLPNATTKEINSGLSNVFITQLHGIMYNSASCITLPDVNPSGVTYSVRLYYSYSNNKISLTTGADRSTYNGYVILEYTKTTDEGDE